MFLYVLYWLGLNIFQVLEAVYDDDCDVFSNPFVLDPAAWLGRLHYPASPSSAPGSLQRTMRSRPFLV